MCGGSKGDDMNEMINPITRTDYPDPDVIRVGDTYYMISTTMYFMPGGVILKSYDLVHWEIETYVFDRLDGTPAECLEGDANEYGKGMWAASLRYHNGRFFVAFVSHGQENTHLFIADEIHGPWEHRMIRGYYHDCSLLFDDDGKVYIVYGNTDIHLTELDAELNGPKPGGIDTVILRDNREDVILGYEGSHFYKINGRYVLTLIHWPKYNMRRTEAVFCSDAPDGPYEGRDVCWDDMGYHNAGVAQGGIVDTPDGAWYSVMFRDSGAVGRIPVLVPVTWKDGCPVFGENGRIPETFALPGDDRRDYPYRSLWCSDEFTDKPGLQWQWNHVPDNRLWTILPEGGLAVTTGKLCRNPVQARNTLTQRMRYPNCAASVEIDASGLKNGDFAGLMALQGRYVMIGIQKENDRYFLVKLAKHTVPKGYGIGSDDREPGEIPVRYLLDRPVVTVRIAADFEDMKDTAECFAAMPESGFSSTEAERPDSGASAAETVCPEANPDRAEFRPVGGAHKLCFRLDHFTGARFGLCVFATKETGGTAVFRHFRYEP